MEQSNSVNPAPECVLSTSSTQPTPNLPTSTYSSGYARSPTLNDLSAFIWKDIESEKVRAGVWMPENMKAASWNCMNAFLKIPLGELSVSNVRDVLRFIKTHGSSPDVYWWLHNNNHLLSTLYTADKLCDTASAPAPAPVAAPAAEVVPAIVPVAATVALSAAATITLPAAEVVAAPKPAARRYRQFILCSVINPDFSSVEQLFGKNIRDLLKNTVYMEREASETPEEFFFRALLEIYDKYKDDSVVLYGISLEKENFRPIFHGFCNTRWQDEHSYYHCNLTVPNLISILNKLVRNQMVAASE